MTSNQERFQELFSIDWDAASTECCEYPVPEDDPEISMLTDCTGTINKKTKTVIEVAIDFIGFRSSW